MRDLKLSEEQLKIYTLSFGQWFLTFRKIMIYFFQCLSFQTKTDRLPIQEKGVNVIRKVRNHFSNDTAPHPKIRQSPEILFCPMCKHVITLFG